MKLKTRQLAAFASFSLAFGVASTASAAGWDTAWQKPASPPTPAIQAVIENQYQATHLFWIEPIASNKSNANGTPMFGVLSGPGWQQLDLGGELSTIVAAPMAGWNHEWAAGIQASGQIFVMAYNGANWDSVWTATGGTSALVATPLAIAATGYGPRIFTVGTDYKIYMDSSYGMGMPWVGWSAIAALPDGQPAGRILAVARGGNNSVALDGNPYIDVVVATQGEGAVYHMKFNTGTQQGSWESVPVPSGYAVSDVALTSTDLNTFEVLEDLGGNTLALYQSSSPGQFVRLSTPQGTGNCIEGGLLFTSPAPGEIKLWESDAKNSEIYTDLYSASPNLAPGLQFCQ